MRHRRELALIVKKVRGWIKKSKMALFAVTQSNQYVVEKKNCRNTKEQAKTASVPLVRGGQAKQFKVNVQFTVKDLAVGLEISQNKQQNNASKSIKPIESKRAACLVRARWLHVRFIQIPKKGHKLAQIICVSGEPRRGKSCVSTAIFRACRVPPCSVVMEIFSPLHAVLR